MPPLISQELDHIAMDCPSLDFYMSSDPYTNPALDYPLLDDTFWIDELLLQLASNPACLFY